VEETRNVFLSVMYCSELGFEAKVMDKFRVNVWLDLAEGTLLAATTRTSGHGVEYCLKTFAAIVSVRT
jgi:hypothetical protein